jgi:hypothetical protein
MELDCKLSDFDHDEPDFTVGEANEYVGTTVGLRFTQ